RIREQATLGGNLAHADPAQDPPVTLLALDDVAVAKSRFGERRIPLEALFTDFFETSLERGEILLRVELPPLPAGARVSYQQVLPATLDDHTTVPAAASAAPSTCASAPSRCRSRGWSRSIPATRLPVPLGCGQTPRINVSVERCARSSISPSRGTSRRSSACRATSRSSVASASSA